MELIPSTVLPWFTALIGFGESAGQACEEHKEVDGTGSTPATVQLLVKLLQQPPAWHAECLLPQGHEMFSEQGVTALCLQLAGRLFPGLLRTAAGTSVNVSEARMLPITLQQ